MVGKKVRRERMDLEVWNRNLWCWGWQKANVCFGMLIGNTDSHSSLCLLESRGNGVFFRPDTLNLWFISQAHFKIPHSTVGNSYQSHQCWPLLYTYTHRSQMQRQNILHGYSCIKCWNGGILRFQDEWLLATRCESRDHYPSAGGRRANFLTLDCTNHLITM
jgi:hypothetical protein